MLMSENFHKKKVNLRVWSDTIIIFFSLVVSACIIKLGIVRKRAHKKNIQISVKLAKSIPFEFFEYR